MYRTSSFRFGFEFVKTRAERLFALQFFSNFLSFRCRIFICYTNQTFSLNSRIFCVERLRFRFAFEFVKTRTERLYVIYLRTSSCTYMNMYKVRDIFMFMYTYIYMNKNLNTNMNMNMNVNMNIYKVRYVSMYIHGH